MDIRVASTFWLLWIMLLWAWVYKYLSPYFQFFWVFTQKWNFWIIWSFYLMFLVIFTFFFKLNKSHYDLMDFNKFCMVQYIAVSIVFNTYVVPSVRAPSTWLLCPFDLALVFYIFLPFWNEKILGLNLYISRSRLGISHFSKMSCFLSVRNDI